MGTSPSIQTFLNAFGKKGCEAIIITAMKTSGTDHTKRECFQRQTWSIDQIISWKLSNGYAEATQYNSFKNQQCLFLVMVFKRIKNIVTKVQLFAIIQNTEKKKSQLRTRVIVFSRLDTSCFWASCVYAVWHLCDIITGIVTVNRSDYRRNVIRLTSFSLSCHGKLRIR